MQLRDRKPSPTQRWRASAAVSLLLILVSATSALAEPPLDDAVSMDGAVSVDGAVSIDDEGVISIDDSESVMDDPLHVVELELGALIGSLGVSASFEVHDDPEPVAPEATGSECGVRGCPVARRRSRCGPRGCPVRRARSSCDDRGCDLARSRRYRGCGRARRAWRGCGSRRADRFALGITRGHFELGETEARERGMLARVRVSRRLTAELEVGETDYRDAAIQDRRVGGSLLLHPVPRARLSPYLSASAGRIRTEMDGLESEIEQRYREVGVGLSLRLGKRLRLEGDVRAGRRGLRDSAKSDIAAAVSAPDLDDEHYRRARFNAMFYF